MSQPNLLYVGPIGGHYRDQSVQVDSDGSPEGEILCAAPGFLGDYYSALGLFNFVPRAIDSWIAANSDATSIELFDFGLWRLQADVLAYDPDVIGRYGSGNDPQRKYGSVGLWQGDSFLGWRQLSRLKNRFFFNGHDAGVPQNLVTYLLNDTMYSVSSTPVLEQYSSNLFGYLTGLESVWGQKINRLTWVLAPSVVIRLRGWNACYGVYKGYNI